MPNSNDESTNEGKQQINLKLKVVILDGVNQITFNSPTTKADLFMIRHPYNCFPFMYKMWKYERGTEIKMVSRSEDQSEPRELKEDKKDRS